MGDDTNGSTRAGDGSSGDGEDQQGADSLGDGPRHGTRRSTHRGRLFSRLVNVLGAGDSHPPRLATEHGEHVNGAAAPLPAVASLRRLDVADVMVPKAEIVSVPHDIGREELAEVFRESGVSRVPVYRGTLDAPVGLVHLKDFALRYGFGARSPRFSLATLMRPLLYVPPSMPLAMLLQKMQVERAHMALVIDEYGGVDGLVTIEDVIEQVVGEIEDEHDVDDEPEAVEEAPGVWLVSATEPLDEFESEIDLRLAGGEEEDEVDTVGGLVMMLAGRVPARGEVVRHPDGHEFVIVDADLRRIKRLRLRLHHPQLVAS